MINTANETPKRKLFGRLSYSLKFIDEDLKEAVVLDVGCGYGWVELNLLKRNIKKIFGIEITEDDLTTAKLNVKDKRVQFVVGSAIDVPFKNDFFDMVVSWEVIEHIPTNTESKMFKEVHRVLKKNGTFYLSTPYASFWSKLFDPAWWLIGHRHYQSDRLIRFGIDNGFMIEKMEIKGGWWEIIGMLNLYIMKWVFRSKPLFDNYIKKRQDLEYRNSNGFTNIFFKFRKI